MTFPAIYGSVYFRPTIFKYKEYEMTFVITPTNNAERVTVSAKRRSQDVKLSVCFSNNSILEAEVPIRDLRRALYSKKGATDFVGSRLSRLTHYKGSLAPRRQDADVFLYTESVNGSDLVTVRWRDLAKALYSIRTR